MRILVAASQGGANGIETYTHRLVESLSRRGHTALLARRPPTGEAAAAALPPSSWPLRRVIGPFESRRTHPYLRRAVADGAIEIVHATYPEFALPSQRTVVTAWHPATSVVQRVRTMRGRGERRILGQALFTLNDMAAFRGAAAVVAVTLDVQRSLLRAGVTAEWVAPFIEDDEVASSPGRRERTCVMVSRWLDEPRKGLPIAIEAVRRARRRCPGLRLVLVGGWHDPGVAKRLPDFCVEAGILDRQGVRSALAGAGCCLMPSTWEEFGYAGIEALAAGTALVTSPLPAFEGVMAEGLLIVDSFDAASWSGAILASLAIEDAELPALFRASVSLPRLVDIYERVALLARGGHR